MLPALVVGALLLVVASLAQSAWQFVAAWALGGAVIGGGLYYNVTMPMTTRLFPQHHATAFSVLTLLGALASPIFYPLAAWAVDLWGWRGGLRALIAVTVLCVAPAALCTRAPAAASTRHEGGARSLGAVLRRPAIYRVLVVFA